MVNRLDMNQLRQALAQELPGDPAKEPWLPQPLAGWPARAATRHASVLLLLVQGDGDLRLPLMRRRRVEGDLHSGQISLPGGRQESGESSLEAALRETQEEIGVDASDLEVLGCLSEHRIPVSGYAVSPYVAWARGPLGYWRDAREVESIFEVSLRRLLDPHSTTERPMDLRGTRFRVPGWDLDEGFLWGATAMILGEFLEVARRVLGEDQAG